jgi:hypothetical protein
LLLLLQVAMYLLFRRLALPQKSKNWGIVYDEGSHEPLARAIVRIFDKKYNKLLETQITDAKGKYGFIVGKNVYYVVGQHPGYATFKSPDIDLTVKGVEGEVQQPIALQKADLKSSPQVIPNK